METSLSERVAVIEHDLRSMQVRLEATVSTQASNHAENGLRLSSMERTLTEIAVYLRIGRWVVNAVWAIGGAVAAASMIKWLSVKT